MLQFSHRSSLSCLSLVFSSVNLSTNEDVDLTMKLSGLFPETIKAPTYPVSVSTIVSTVALACASGNQIKQQHQK